jgi:hypothetical protein
MDKTEKKNLEIALLLCIPESFKKRGLRKGRQQNLVMKIMNELDGELKRTHRVDKSRVDPLADMIVQFSRRLGWDKGKHAHTILAFGLEIMERSEYKYSRKLWDSMTGLVAHIENITPTYPACCRAGILAADKWEAMMGKS